MKVTFAAVVSAIAIVIALSVGRPAWWWVPLTVLVASLVDARTRQWVMSERLGSARTLSLALKSVCSLFVLYALLGQFVCIGLGIWWLSSSRTPEWTDDEVANAQHLSRSMEASRAATRVFNAQTNETSVPDATVQEVLRLKQSALTEASLVRNDVLEKARPGFGKIWREKYQRSLELSISAIRRGDAAGQVQARVLWNEWVDWINAHKSDVRIPKLQPSPSRAPN